MDTAHAKGTAFNVYLPEVAEGNELAKKQIPVTPPEHSRKNERILVVDDEESIRDLLKEMLERLDYDVMVCENGDDALSCYSKYHEEINLVILDMIMPGMDGKDVFTHMQKINPNINAIVISGYSRNEQIQSILDLGVKAHLPKPFQYSELAKIVRN